MLDLVFNYTIVPFVVDIVPAVARACTAVTNAFRFKPLDSKFQLPGTWPLEPEELHQLAVASPLPSDEDTVFYEDGDVVMMADTTRWLAAAEEPKPSVGESEPTAEEPEQQFHHTTSRQNNEEFGPWVTEEDKDVSSDRISDDISSYTEFNRNRIEGQKIPATVDAIKNGLQNVLNKRAARASNKPAPAPAAPTTPTGRKLPEFKLRTRDLRSLPPHLDPRFRQAKMYTSTWQPSGRGPSDVSPTEPKPEGPVDAWVGDQLHKQPIKFYVDPDCRGSTPGTVAAGLPDSNSSIKPTQSVQENEEEEEERRPLDDIPMPDHANEAAPVDEGGPSQVDKGKLPVRDLVTPVRSTYEELPGDNGPENMPVIPVPLEEYIQLKEIADKAQTDSANFEARLEEEFKRLREEMVQQLEGRSSHHGQLSDQESEQHRRPAQTRTLPIALSPSLGSQIPCNLLGKSVLRRGENIPTKVETKQPLSELDNKVELLKRVLEKDAATVGALRNVDVGALAHGAQTDQWDQLTNAQQAALFSTMLQVAAKEQQDAIELAEKVGRATVKVLTNNKRPDEAVKAERDLFKNIFDKRFDDFWHVIRPNLSFDKDPLALYGRRQYPPFYPATGQMPPKPPRDHVKMEFAQIRDELEMNLREIRRFSKQFFSAPGAEELSPEMHEYLLGMCGGSREVLKNLLQNKETKCLLVSGFLKRILFDICLGTGWIWQGYDDNLSGLFSLEHTPFSDPAYKYQRTVALTWRAHRFTQLTYQPWWDHMLELRIKLTADEIYKLLRPMLGEDRTKLEFRQVEPFMDLLEIVEIFSKLAAKMYEQEALWSFYFPGNGEGFEGTTMVLDDPCQNQVIAIRGSE
ncbi:uncharacterized protein DFL_001552 [Arthrobotrys flagrans]|uniref:Uncharacterized protein n=1 Tax=Arthrobotrys flagrans TaxID=97331 RepID=A0A437A8A8_ARTFL|nr:hypothetical protein DFL_001552 [Arthrobotrys flagrans]